VRVQTIKIPTLPAFSIEVHDSSDQFLSKFVMETGMYEPTDTIAVVRLLSSTVDFVDLGANVGWYTLIAGTSLRGRGRVHSFEPDPDNFAKLSANIARNGLDNVAIHQCAVSDQAGNSLLYRSTDNLGDHQLYNSGDGRAAVPVEVRTLDSYADISRERPVIVKMDTQGSELRILRGMNALLTGHPHEVLILSEFWPKGLVNNGSSPQEMIELLTAAGFSILLIDPQRNALVPVTWNFVAECTAGAIAPATEKFMDFIFFRRRDGLMRALFDAN
jgi:FkbM family methyltransferase